MKSHIPRECDRIHGILVLLFAARWPAVLHIQHEHQNNLKDIKSVKTTNVIKTHKTHINLRDLQVECA